ncbi:MULTISPECIES: hypothetical protein [unclassified Flavobacterium]|nr:MULTISPECIES: hypothetical protein [unclassified Flavobacterium]
MKRKRIGERSDGFDVLASQVNFNRLKMHRNKTLCFFGVSKKRIA